MDVRKDICGFEDLGPFQGRLVYKGELCMSIEQVIN
jgi:hypothetical protein